MYEMVTGFLLASNGSQSEEAFAPENSNSPETPWSESLPGGSSQPAETPPWGESLPGESSQPEQEVPTGENPESEESPWEDLIPEKNSESEEKISTEDSEEGSEEEGDGQESLQTGADTGNIVMIGICAASVLFAIIAILVAVLTLCKKRAGNANSPKKQAPVRTTGSVISLRLEVYAGRCRNKTPLLTLRDSLTIGSSEDCDIVFADPEVAAKNSRIRLIEGQMYIEDLQSPQGTALDGMRFQGRNRLCGGEVISIGAVEFSVSVISSGQ